MLGQAIIMRLNITESWETPIPSVKIDLTDRTRNQSISELRSIKSDAKSDRQLYQERAQFGTN